MAAFINNDITTAGLIVLAKGVAGQKINYTKIVLGDGYLEEGQTPRTLTGVVSPKATIDITKCVVNGDGTVTVGGVWGRFVISRTWSGKVLSWIFSAQAWA